MILDSGLLFWATLYITSSRWRFSASRSGKPRNRYTETVTSSRFAIVTSASDHKKAKLTPWWC